EHQGQGEREQAALRQSLDDRPDPDARQGRQQQAQQPSRRRQRQDQGQAPLVRPPRSRRGYSQGGGQLDQDQNGEDQAGGLGVEAPLAQDGRQPPQDTEGQGRLKPHEEGHAPGQGVTPKPWNRRGLSPRAWSPAPRQRQPDQADNDDRRGPHRQAHSPAPAQRGLDGNGDRSRQGGAAGDGRDIGPRQPGGAGLKIALHERWQQHTGRGDGGAGQDRKRKQGPDRSEGPARRAQGDHQERAEQAALHAPPSRQPRRKGCDNAKTQNRQGREQADLPGRQTRRQGDLGQAHRKTGEHQPQTEGGSDDSNRQEASIGPSRRVLGHHSDSAPPPTCKRISPRVLQVVIRK